MRRISICFLLVLAAVSTAWPQASTSTVRGTVRDQGQAVVPAAKVTTNTATNVERTTNSNEAGLFVFPGEFPGPHRLTVEVPGMQKYEANLTVQAQQDVGIDVVLQVGQTTTQVEVVDVTPLLVTGNATLGHTLERQRIEQLPVNGRGLSGVPRDRPRHRLYRYPRRRMACGRTPRPRSSTAPQSMRFGKAGISAAFPASTRCRKFALRPTTPPRNSRARRPFCSAARAAPTSSTARCSKPFATAASAWPAAARTPSPKRRF